jgi:hypothetical protein
LPNEPPVANETIHAAAVERWLREEVIPIYGAMEADPARGVRAEQVMASLRKRHTERSKIINYKG